MSCSPRISSTDRLLPGQGPTHEDFKRSVAEILDAFATTSFTIEEQIAQGDTVITKYTEGSVIRGEFAGLPPTGTEEMFEGIYIHRISDGKIPEERSQASTLRTTLERLEQETRERARRAGPQGGPKYPVSLAPQGGT